MIVSRIPLKFMLRNQRNWLKNEAYTVDSVNTGGVIVADRSWHLNKKGRNLESPKLFTNALSSVAKDNYLLKDARIRRLTPVECERLQGFPDGWTEFGYMKGNIITTEPVYDWREIVTEPDGDVERRWVKICEKDIDPIKDSIRISDTQRYRALGNAVTVNVIEFLGHMLKKSLFGVDPHSWSISNLTDRNGQSEPIGTHNDAKATNGASPCPTDLSITHAEAT